MVRTGLSELPGSCGIRLTTAPRMESSRFCDQFVMSVPLRRMVPASTRPLPASRPRVACAVVVLPEPDSPTSATTSPGATLKETPCTTRCSRSPVL